MFPKYYELVITAIFIFFNIVEISSFQDSVYLNDSYDNKLQVLKRYERQTAFDLCLIPSYPLHTNYKVSDQFKSQYKPGEYAPNLATLEIICDKGFKLNPLAQNQSVCVQGVWAPRLPNCIRACPSLNSTISTNVNCVYNNTNLDNCYDPVEQTTVLVSCNPLYEDSTVDVYPDHLCLDGQWEPHIPQCRPICGQKRPLGKVNIINGSDAIQGNYPWHVGIYNATNQDYLCGGAIIARNIILSAAHCFADYDGNVFSPERYLVAGGKYHRSYDHNSDKYSQYSKIHKINVPEKYKGTTTSEAHDIAVLILKNPFSISSALQPVCIELNEQLQQLYLSAHSIGIVTGWGHTKEGRELADVLKEVKIPHIPFDKCYDEFPVSFRKYFSSDKICGGYRNSATSICTGDSGGALVFRNKITDRFYIKGVVSTSPATIAQQCDSSQYSLYTSISAHLQFIRDVVIHNQLYYSAECKYNKCTLEDEEIIKTIHKTEEIVTHLKKELSYKLIGSGNVDDICAPLIKCSCIYVLFLSTSETIKDPPEAIREIIQDALNINVQHEYEYQLSHKNCKPGHKCYSLRSAVFKLPGDYKRYIPNFKKLLQDGAADNMINTEIFVNYDQCSINWFGNKASERISEIFKTAAEMGQELNIEF